MVLKWNSQEKPAKPEEKKLPAWQGALIGVGVAVTIWAFGLIGLVVLWGIPYGIYRLVKKVRGS